VQMSAFRIEEGKGFSRLGDAAGHQQLGQHLRQAGGFSQLGSLGRMRLDETPALAKELALGFLWPGLRQGWPRNCPVAVSAHRAYSSSSL